MVTASAMLNTVNLIALVIPEISEMKVSAVNGGLGGQDFVGFDVDIWK